MHVNKWWIILGGMIVSPLGASAAVDLQCVNDCERNRYNLLLCEQICRYETPWESYNREHTTPDLFGYENIFQTHRRHQEDEDEDEE